MNWKKIIDDRNFEIIEDEESNNELEISDDEEDEEEENEVDNGDYDCFYKNNKQLINFSRTIVETISKMIDRLKYEEQEERAKDLLKKVKI